MRRTWTDEDKTKRVVKAFVEAEDENDKEHTGLLMLLFGYEAKIGKAEFVSAMTVSQKWFWNTREISNKMKPFNNDLWLKDYEENQE